jgi:hypothetical protein
VSSRDALIIRREVTDDLFDGRPCPPIDDRLWALVRSLTNKQSLWRAISISRGRSAAGGSASFG